MNDKRVCPVMKADVEVQVFCFACGHHDKESTACQFTINQHLVKLGHMKQSEFDAKHSFLGR